MNKQQFINKFLHLPYSINNLYGDPFFPTQVENTFKKLDTLVQEGHKGVVSIITKTEITEVMATRLHSYVDKLNLVVLVSCSGLPYSIERVKGNRINTIKLCVQYSIPVLPYIRPFIPDYNTNAATIDSLFKSISEAGLDVVVISGLRGNDQVLSNLDLTTKEKQSWSARVKIIPSDMRSILTEASAKYNIHLFERTSCGVTFILGDNHSYNPYYASPQLAKCHSCPLKQTCFDVQEWYSPVKEDLDFVTSLGYTAELIDDVPCTLCKVQPEKRTECVSCCTSCFILKRPRINVLDKNLSLGDISFLRLLTGTLISCEGLVDSGESDIAIPHNPLLKGLNLYFLNSWASYSRNTSSCYNCSYCIVPSYKNQQKEYGLPPREMASLIWNRIHGGDLHE